MFLFLFFQASLSRQQRISIKCYILQVFPYDDADDDDDGDSDDDAVDDDDDDGDDDEDDDGTKRICARETSVSTAVLSKIQ